MDGDFVWLYELDDDDIDLIQLAHYYAERALCRNDDGFPDDEEPGCTDGDDSTARHRDALRYSRFPIRYWEIVGHDISVRVDGDVVEVSLFVPDDECDCDDLPW